MGSGDQCEAVGVVEGLGDVLSEGVSSTTRGDAPAAAVIRVRPQQVTHGTLKSIHCYYSHSQHFNLLVLGLLLANEKINPKRMTKSSTDYNVYNGSD